MSASTQLHHLVRDAAARWGDAPALSYRDATLTYAELWRRVVVFAAALRRDGIGRGERVAIYSEKRIDAVVSMLGAAAAGAVFVPVNPLLRPAQVHHILADCEVGLLVTSADRLALLLEGGGAAPLARALVMEGETAAPVTEAPPAVVGWSEFVEEIQPVAEPDLAIDVDPAAIFYTSGSTGKPKGVVVSHRNLVAGAESVAGYIGNRPDDRILAMLPLSFDAGFSQLSTGFAAGAEVVLFNYLLPRDVVSICAERGITGMTAVPPLWIQLAEQEWPREASAGLRYFASTGGRMPRETLDRLRRAFPGAAPYLMYGLTEAFRSTYLDPAEVDRRPDSIGKAIPNAEIVLVREDGARCAPGEQGELVHRGALVALGYWGDPERTAERFRPAPARDAGLPGEELAVWSGDLAVEDEEGFLYFVGRDDEMIKTSGYRVSPSEVEEAAHGTGLVGEAVAVGVEDPRLGQRIVLVAAPPPEVEEVDAAALLGELRRRLPGYMLPKQVETRSQLPRSANGKFDRTAIRRELGER